jgi:ribosomal protein S18 acetylase RimI-like enzyme
LQKKIFLIKYTPFKDHQPGLIFDMLMKSYEACPEIVVDEQGSWREYDSSIFEHPETIGRCGFVSCLEEGVPIGFASWDPRNHPDFVIIGHNCILPDYQNNGFGRLQIMEMLERFRAMDFRKARTSTGATEFFLPAQKMYLSCGFYETGRIPHERIPDFQVIHYERII